MGILVSEKSTFSVVVKYILTDDGEVHIITDADVENLGKSKEELEGLEDTLTHATDVPFNEPVNLLDHSVEDVREATFNFRKPAFDDVPVLLSSFASINSDGQISPGDLFKFNNRKLKLLFVSGTAQDEKGNKIKITMENLGLISPTLGSAMVVRMNDHINF